MRMGSCDSPAMVGRMGIISTMVNWWLSSTEANTCTVLVGVQKMSKVEHYFQEVDEYARLVPVDMIYYNTYRVLNTTVSIQFEDEKDLLVFVHTIELL